MNHWTFCLKLYLTSLIKTIKTSIGQFFDQTDWMIVLALSLRILNTLSDYSFQQMADVTVSEISRYCVVTANQRSIIPPICTKYQQKLKFSYNLQY